MMRMECLFVAKMVGVAKQFNCENDVDICIGTLNKAASCRGGFIACR